MGREEGREGAAAEPRVMPPHAGRQAPRGRAGVREEGAAAGRRVELRRRAASH